MEQGKQAVLKLTLFSPRIIAATKPLPKILTCANWGYIWGYIGV
jgi:hypothetical protein